MKSIAIVRTRDEEHNIERFCQSYSWASKILVADACSEDNTMLLAKNFINVEVRTYNEWIEMENGYRRSPQGDQLNFLNEWAIEEGADWIFMDDCDSVPNWWIRHHIQRMLPDIKHDFIYAIRLYLWGEDKHFPKMAQPAKEGEWATSLWGWRAKSGLEFRNTHNSFTFSPKPGIDERENLMPPYCLLHYSWVDEDRLNRKLTYYRESGQHPTILHPLEYAGTPIKLPEWAIL